MVVTVVSREVESQEVAIAIGDRTGRICGAGRYTSVEALALCVRCAQCVRACVCACVCVCVRVSGWVGGCESERERESSRMRRHASGFGRV